MSYYLAPSLVELRNEVNRLFPNRDKSSDGWVGDTSHAARPSDHNPDWSSNGVVRAIDIDIDDNDRNRNLRRMLLSEVIGDPRVWYVISNGIIYSSTYGWTARKYTGSNPHTKHVHISIKGTRSAEKDTSPWFGPAKPARRQRLPISLSTVRKEFRAAIDGEKVGKSHHVKRVQRRLRRMYDVKIKVDGYVGKATLSAWGKHEAAEGGKGRRRVPDEISMKRLVRNSAYRVIE